MEQKITLIDLIQRSILLDTDYKIKLISEVELYDEKQVADLISFFELEKGYAQLDKEGITAKITEIVQDISK